MVFGHKKTLQSQLTMLHKKKHGKKTGKRLTERAMLESARRLLLVQHGAESKMAVPAVAPGKELAVLGHGDGEVTSARRHRPRPDSWDAGGALRAPSSAVAQISNYRAMLESARCECAPAVAGAARRAPAPDGPASDLRPSRSRQPPPAPRAARHPCQVHNKLVLLARTGCARGVTGALREAGTMV